jgi:signal transduction histidine kinase
VSPAAGAASGRHAAAEPSSREVVEAQGRVFSFDGFLRSVFDGVPVPCFVVNEHRQLAFANRALLAMVDAAEPEVIGRRPGEILGCAHSDESPQGCGFSAACETCAAPAAILAAIGGRPTTRDCRISLKRGECLDLRLTATPIRGDAAGALVAVVDTSNEQRRRALEHIFFHDVLNTAGEVRGLVSLVREAQSDELLRLLEGTADRLIDEIQAQRQLASAEVGDLIIQPVLIRSSALLHDIGRSHNSHEAAIGKGVGVDPAADDVEFTSDRALLSRVLGNLALNALEACGDGMQVTLGCRAGPESVDLWVHNPTPMPRPVQLQVFHRSFSTKGPGRGLGTYSAKMLTERYLRGRLSFTSTPGEGTTFTVCVPYAPGSAFGLRGAIAEEAVPGRRAAR